MIKKQKSYIPEIFNRRSYEESLVCSAPYRCLHCCPDLLVFRRIRFHFNANFHTDFPDRIRMDRVLGLDASKSYSGNRKIEGTGFLFQQNVHGMVVR